MGTPSARNGLAHLVRLFEADPDLLDHLPEDRQSRLRRQVVVPVHYLRPGPWEEPLGDHAAIGILVLEGLLCRDTTLFARRSVELLGAGDVLRPWQRLEPTSIPSEALWRVLTPTQLAILDQDITAILSRVPGVVPELFARAIRRSRWLAYQAALSRIRGISSRLLVLFWLLADRWGIQKRDHVLVRAPLSHELLSHLVSAERPSVSHALKALSERGLISRREDGLWLLHGGPPETFEELILVQRIERGEGGRTSIRSAQTGSRRP
jgi:CRP/FNR family cyclic AMP-dependent transcriptional regulator